MPAKRKSDIPADPPSEKKKPKTPTTQKKRSVSEAEVETASSTVRKKKKSTDSSDGSSPVPKTPKQRRVSKKIVATTDTELSEPESVKKSTKKTAKSTQQVDETPKSEKKSAAKATRRKSVKSATSSPASSASSAISSPGKRSSAATQKSMEVEANTYSPQQDKLQDEGDIMSLWNQSLAALHICLLNIGPIFIFAIIMSYIMGKIQGSQAIASVGVVYTLLCLAIMGSYVVGVLPFILISRVFTAIVSPHAGGYTEQQINFYCRLLSLIAVVPVAVAICAFL